MDETVKTILKGIKKTGDHVFCNEEGETFVRLQRSFEAAVRKSKIENFRFHDLRYTFASNMVMGGRFEHGKRIIRSQRFNHDLALCPSVSEPQNQSSQHFRPDYVTKSPANRKGLKGATSKALKSLAGGRGVEPRFAESESGVLPLNDPPTTTHCKFQIVNFKLKIMIPLKHRLINREETST